MTEKIEEKRKQDRRARAPGGWEFDFLAMIFTICALAMFTLDTTVASVLGVISCVLWLAWYFDEKRKN